MKKTKYLLIVLFLIAVTIINYLAPVVCIADMPSHVQEYENVYIITVQPNASEEEANIAIELGWIF